MITLGRAAFQTELRFNEYYGLSTDEKPTAETVAQTVNDLIQQLIAAGIMADA